MGRLIQTVASIANVFFNKAGPKWLYRVFVCYRELSKPLVVFETIWLPGPINSALCDSWESTDQCHVAFSSLCGFGGALKVTRI